MCNNVGECFHYILHMQVAAFRLYASWRYEAINEVVGRRLLWLRLLYPARSPIVLCALGFGSISPLGHMMSRDPIRSVGNSQQCSGSGCLSRFLYWFCHTVVLRAATMRLLNRILLCASRADLYMANAQLSSDLGTNQDTEPEN